MDSGEKTATLQNPKIYAAIAGVISDCGFVSKDKVNKQQGFKYRSVDDVFNALHPALAKNKVFIVPTILERKEDVIGHGMNLLISMQWFLYTHSLQLLISLLFLFALFLTP